MKTTHFAVLAAVVAGGALLHRLWGHPGEVEVQRRVLANVAGRLGDWRPGSVKEQPAEPDRPYSCTCDFARPAAGMRAIATLISGHPGEVAAHTPEVCYPGSGYKMAGGKSRETVDLPGGGTAQFWTADFTRKVGPGFERVRVRWAWTADGRWQASDYPRWSYGLTAPGTVLHKILVVHNVAEGEDPADAEGYRDFLARLIPGVNRELGF